MDAVGEDLGDGQGGQEAEVVVAHSLSFSPRLSASLPSESPSKSQPHLYLSKPGCCVQYYDFTGKKTN